VSSLYDFPARRQSSSQGRWIAPDPAGRSAVSLANPQSWNRYAYAGNNPIALIDPTGLEDCDARGAGPHGMDCGGDPPCTLDGECGGPGGDGDDDDDNNGNNLNNDCDAVCQQQQQQQEQQQQLQPLETCDLLDPSCNPGAISTWVPASVLNDFYGQNPVGDVYNQYLAEAVGDPCVYTQVDANGQYTHNKVELGGLNQQQCQQQAPPAGYGPGQWVPPGYGYQVDSWGQVHVNVISDNACLTWGSINWWATGGLAYASWALGPEVGIPATFLRLGSGALQSSMCSGGGAVTF
jgi:RHS repeat-associated protein